MAARNKNKKPLTPLQNLMLATIDGALGVRARVLTGGRAYGRNFGKRVDWIKVEHTVLMIAIREAILKGELPNTSELADRVEIDRKAAERALKKLDAAGLIRSEDIGREMKHYYTADVLENSVSVAAHIGHGGGI